MPTQIYAYHRPAEVVAIPLEEHIECNIVLAYLKNRTLPKTALAFIDFMVKVVADG